MNLRSSALAFTLFLCAQNIGQAVNIIIDGPETEGTVAHPDGDALFTVDDGTLFPPDGFTFGVGAPTANIASATPWTFPKSQLNYRSIDSVVYAEFVIVMNENGSGNTVTMNDFSISSGALLLWDLDSGGDNSVTFNEGTVNFAAGGNSDAEIAIHIPHTAFAGLQDTDTISISYSFTAATAGPDTIGIGGGDGTIPPVTIPEPSALLLFLIGVGASLSRRRR